MTTDNTLLRVRGLRTYFHTFDGTVRAVDGISFRIAPRQTFALVGESGCGKTVTALSILRLVDCPPGQIAGGSIELAGTRLLDLPERDMRDVRGGKISSALRTYRFCTAHPPWNSASTFPSSMS